RLRLVQGMQLAPTPHFKKKVRKALAEHERQTILAVEAFDARVALRKTALKLYGFRKIPTAAAMNETYRSRVKELHTRFDSRDTDPGYKAEFEQLTKCKDHLLS